MQIRPIERRDAEPTRAIYNAAVESGTSNLDHLTRTAQQHLEWLDAHFGGYPAIVAEESDGTILGFAAVSPYSERSGYTTSVEDSIYVAPSVQGQGVGRALLSELCTIAADTGYHSIVAYITAMNEGSIALHRACGFEPVGVLREIGRKRGRWFDVTVMQRIFAE